MQDLVKWGIMTDWRYSYFTMMPAYESHLLNQFALLTKKGLIFRGQRAVFYSIEQ